MVDDTIRLFHAMECPFSMRARLVLSEKRLPYESYVVTLDDVGDEVRRLNPKGTVPVLVHGDCAVYEAEIIAEYLEDRYPEPRLYPSDPMMRARARMLIDWADAMLVGPVHGLEQAHLNEGVEGEPTDEAHQEELQRVKACIHTISDLIQPEGFVLGNMGIVDLFLAPFVVDLAAIGVRRDEVPAKVADWIDRLRDRPSIVQQARAREAALGLRVAS